MIMIELQWTPILLFKDSLHFSIFKLHCLFVTNCLPVIYDYQVVFAWNKLIERIYCHVDPKSICQSGGSYLKLRVSFPWISFVFLDYDKSILKDLLMPFMATNDLIWFTHSLFDLNVSSIKYDHPNSFYLDSLGLNCLIHLAEWLKEVDLFNVAELLSFTQWALTCIWRSWWWGYLNIQ